MESQGPSGVKYIVWCVLGVIAILVTVKQLGFTPTKITTGSVSVELTGGIAPAAAHPDSPRQQEAPASTPRPDTAQLENRVHDLESQLAARSLPTHPDSPQEQRPQQRSAFPNIAGNWRADPLGVSITQNGSSVVMQVFTYGVLSSAGYGTLRGNDLQVNYTNNLGIPGRMEATVSPDADRMEVTDYGRGYPQSVSLFRAR